MSADPTLNHEYLTIGGLGAFTDAASRLLLGDSSLAITQNRVWKSCHVLLAVRVNIITLDVM